MDMGLENGMVGEEKVVAPAALLEREEMIERTDEIIEKAEAVLARAKHLVRYMEMVEAPLLGLGSVMSRNFAEVSGNASYSVF